MNTLKDAIEKARSEAQDLHKTIEASTAKNHAAMRAEFQNVATRAHDLSYSAKTLAESQSADAKQHLKDAASSLADTAKHAKTVASAADSDIKQAAAAAVARARDAVRSLGAAVAAKRATAKG